MEEQQKEGNSEVLPAEPSVNVAPPAAPSAPSAPPPLAKNSFYSEDEIARMKFFYKKREGNPTLYTYDESGDLAMYSQSGSVTETIALRSYVAHSKEIKDNRDQDRLDEISEAETAYEVALESLRKAREEYQSTKEAQPYLAAHKEMVEADMILSRKRYGQRGLQILPNPSVRDVLFDQPHEVRKLFPMIDPFKRELIRLITREYPYYSFEGSYTGEAAAAAPVESKKEQVVEPRQLLKDGRYARMIFQEGSGENDIFSPFWPVEFTTDNGKYSSALQAYEVARELEAFNMGDIDAAKHADLQKKLLGTRSGGTIMRYMKEITTQVKDPKGTWMMIYTNIFEQHEELKKRLLATGTDAFVFVFKEPAGVGMDANPSDPATWKGDNAVGSALEELRTEFREGRGRLAGVRNVAPGQSVISVEEQAAARQNAIMGAQKKKAFTFKSRAPAP